MLLQAAREDATAAVVEISTRLAQRDTGKFLSTEEAKAPVIAKIVQSGTVAAGSFRTRDEGDGEEG